MPVESKLHFSGYEVDTIVFNLNRGNLSASEYDVEPSFSRTIIDCGNNNYDIGLILSIKSTPEKPMLFDLEIGLTGHFHIEDPSENEAFHNQLIKRNTISILYPFLRSIVATITSAANISSLLLPVIDLSIAFIDEDMTE